MRPGVCSRACGSRTWSSRPNRNEPVALRGRAAARCGTEAARGDREVRVPTAEQSGPSIIDGLGGALLLRADLLEHGLVDLAHRQATIHRGLLDPAEGFGLAQTHRGLEQALGPLDELAGLEALGEVGDLGFQGADLRMPRECDLECRNEV